MSSIDRRIVDMRFNNRDFQKNARDTVDTLEDLKGALNLGGAAEGMADVEKSASKFSFRGIIDGVKNAVQNFPILGAVGFSAIHKLTGAAMDFGRKFIANVVNPITEGGKRRALNIEQAQFQLEGLGIAWEEIQPAILGAVEGTAFGLDEAARAASQLAASQVPMDRMEGSLRGISGVAAMTGSSYEDIANVFTKVAGQGRLMGDDLLRLSSRGMNAAATLAEAFDMTEAEVREMVTAGQVDFEMFATAMDDAFGEHATKANETYTGALANMNAALARVGASAATIKMEKHRRMFNALSPAIDDVAAALGPLWVLMEERAERSAAKFENLIEGLRARFADDLAGGVEAVVNGVRNIFAFFDSLSETARNAWQAVFPSGESGPSTFFTTIGQGFERLTELLGNTEGMMTVLGKVLEFVFRGIRIALDSISTGAQLVGVAFSWIAEQANWLWGYIEPVIGNISDLFSGMEFGGSGGGFFDQLAESLIWLKDMAMIPIQAVIDRLRPAFDALFAAAERGEGRIRSFFGAFAGIVEEISEGISSINVFDNAFVDFFRNAGARVASVWETIKPPLMELWEYLKVLGSGIREAFQNLGGDDITAAINTGVIAAVAAVIIGFIKDIEMGTRSVRVSMARVNAALNDVRVTLRAYQIGIHADTLRTIATSILLLAGALWVMSKIDTEGLGAASLAMLGLMAGVTAMMAALAHLSGISGAAKTPLITAGMMAMSVAILAMSAALKVISTIDSDQLASATNALIVTMGAMAGFMAILAVIAKTVNPVSLIAISVALHIMVGAIMMLSAAVVALGLIPYDVIEQGLTTLGILMGGLVVSAVIFAQLGPRLLLGAAGMVAMALALNMLIIPVTAFGLIPWPVLIQGMVVLGILMAGLVTAAVLLGERAPHMMLASVGMVAMALALQMMVPSILALGLMDMGTLIQGLIGVGAAMGMLVIAANLMKQAMPGAVAMISMAAALNVLTIAVLAMSAVPFGALMQGLLGVAIALGLLLAAGALAKFAAPGLLVLSVAAIALGAGMLMLSTGLMIFGPAAAVAAGGLVLLGMAAAEIAPYVLELLAVGAGFIVFGAGLLLVAAAAILLGAALAIMGVGMTLIAAAAIPAGQALVQFVEEMTNISLLDLGKLAAVAATFAVLGAALLVLGAGAALTGVGLLAFSIGWAATSVAILLTANPVIDALQRMSTSIPPLLATLGTSMMSAAASIASSTTLIGVSFARMATQIVSSVRSSVGAMRSAGSELGMSLLAGIMSTVPMVLAAGVLYVTTLTTALLAGVGPIGQAANRLVTAFVTPLTRSVRTVQTAGRLLVTTYSQALRSGRNSIQSAGNSLGRAAIAGIRSGTSGQVATMRNSGYSVGLAFSQGVARGINAGGYGVSMAARNVAANAARAARAALDIKSPSREGVEIGRMFDLGIESGMYQGIKGVESAATEVGSSSIGALRDAINKIGDEVFDEFDDDFTIRPVLDLSDVESKASRLGDILQPAISSQGSPGSRAASLSGMRIGRHEVPIVAGATTIHYEQTNNSPKSLQAADIYRHTKNGLSRLRDSIERE